jgi:glycosyltransferase involved in cell wall biosynthesis
VHTAAVIASTMVAVLLIGTAIDFVMGSGRIVWLADVEPVAGGPRVSIVAAARDEARDIAAAAKAFLALEYPDLEVIVVDDRSTDATGAILDELAAHDARLRVVHVDVLPDGWLGKTHALQAGADRASGEWLLLTDGDVVLEPTTIGRAMAYAARTGIDHLAAIPDAALISGWPLKAFVAAFGIFFSVYTRPWRARDPRSRAHIGIGAFNLIRADVYRAIGGHRRIALRPDEDIRLGQIIKMAGYRQDVVCGAGHVMVEWYRSLGELVNGLMKNAFAGLNYSLPLVAASTASLLLVNVWPFVGILATHGAARLFNVVSAVCIVVIFWASTRYSSAKLRYVIGYPAAAILFAYIIWRSALLAVVRGQITWRGTAYPLSRLRANRI